MDGNKEEIGDKIPFDINIIDSYVGKEFIIAATGVNSAKNLQKSIDKYRSEHAEELKITDTAEKKANRKISAQLLNKYCGSIIEVNKRSESINNYLWGDPSIMKLENGNPLSSLVGDSMLKHFIFVPESIKHDDQITLVGKVRKYASRKNKFQFPINGDLEIIFDKIPEYKTRIMYGF